MPIYYSSEHFWMFGVLETLVFYAVSGTCATHQSALAGAGDSLVYQLQTIWTHLTRVYIEFNNAACLS